MTGKNIFFTDESVKRQITDSISENLTDSDLESKSNELIVSRLFSITGARNINLIFLLLLCFYIMYFYRLIQHEVLYKKLFQNRKISNSLNFNLYKNFNKFIFIIV